MVYHEYHQTMASHARGFYKSLRPYARAGVGGDSAKLKWYSWYRKNYG